MADKASDSNQPDDDELFLAAMAGEPIDSVDFEMESDDWDEDLTDDDWGDWDALLYDEAPDGTW